MASSPTRFSSFLLRLYISKSTENTLQISDTQVIGAKTVNETRFQFNHDNSTQNPQDVNPAVSVLGSFLGGGNSEGTLNDAEKQPRNSELHLDDSWEPHNQVRSPCPRDAPNGLIHLPIDEILRFPTFSHSSSSLRPSTARLLRRVYRMPQSITTTSNRTFKTIGACGRTSL